MKVLRYGWLLVGWIPLILSAQPSGAFDIVSANVTSYHSYNSMSRLVYSSEDEVIVGWRSARQGIPYNNIYLQKLDLAGKPAWEKDGLPVCPYPANQSNFSMVADGYGGIVVVWEDYRSGAEQPVIYAQRINLRGEPLWGREGLRICQEKGAQRKPQIISDQDNGFYVIWEDHRAGINETDLYAQYLDLGGRVRWREAGMPIVTSPNLQQNFEIATDENHYLYLIWEDFRNGLYWNLFAQKLDRKGNFFWKAGGLDIFAGVEENHQRPAIVTDGYGGLLFVYQKYSGETHGTDIYRGRLNTRGELMFHFATCYSQDEQLNPRIVKKGSKALLCWEDRRYGNWDLYAQMIRIGDGILEWDINGVPVVKGPGDQRDPVVITAISYGYQVFSWLEREGKQSRVHVQKMNNLGEPAFGREGKVICEYSSLQTEPAILPDEQGGLWCSWTDRRGDFGANIFLQHINGDGIPLLPRKGLELAAKHSQRYARVANPKTLATRAGHFFVVWEDYRNGERDPDIYIQKLDASGEPAWRNGGIPVCLAPGGQNRPILIDDGVGGVIVAWVDGRNMRDENIYAQRISSWGKMLWRSSGVLVCDAPSDQSGLRGVPDGKEGVVLCWVDARTLNETGFDLYIQRLDHAGEPLWQANGKPFSRFPGLQTSASLVSDGQGGAYITWMDSRTDFSNIYVQHINAFGIYEWEYGGRCLVPAARNQRDPVIARNFQDDLYLVWQEGRYGDGYEKLFMQCISPSGRKLWDPQGVLVCDYPGRQSHPAIVTNAFGDFWVTWLDERNKRFAGVELRAQKFNITGESQWQPDGITIGQSMLEWNDHELVINGRDNVYLSWNQLTARDLKNVFYQKLRTDGSKKYGWTGIRMGDDAEDQLSPALSINKDGRVLIVWVQRAPNEEQYGLRATFVEE